MSALAGGIDSIRAALLIDRLKHDTEPVVRAEAAEALGTYPNAVDALLAARMDDVRVVEAVVTALGAISHIPSVPWLIDQANTSDDPLVREAAVAALGEIGDQRAVKTLIELSAGGPPQVRRRAVVALTVFDGPAIQTALRRAASDRNPMVREAAEMVVGAPEEW